MDVPINGAGLQILIVDDHTDCALSTELLLRLHGHQVQVVGDGPAALEKARTEKPDVVLLDIGLPGLSGYDVARQLRADSTGKMPLLIAVTGRGQEEDCRQSREAGIDLHLVKPVDPEKLLNVLDRFQRVIPKQPG